MGDPLTMSTRQHPATETDQLTHALRVHQTGLDDLCLNAAIKWPAQDTATRLGLRFSLSLKETP